MRRRPKAIEHCIHLLHVRGEERQTANGNCERHFFVAGNGRRRDNAARLALGVQNAATIAFGFDTGTAKGEEAGSIRFAAALNVAAAETSLHDGWNEFERKEMDAWVSNTRFLKHTPLAV